MIKENIKEVKNYVSKSNLPTYDYVINPYVGCPHACKYCYASFMKRFTNHNQEDWGSFIDVKVCDNKINIKKLENKTVSLSSVTDCYNPLEAKYQITRGILEQFKGSNVILGIVTKSKLILRDIDILKQIKNLTVAISINTLDEDFKNDMDRASSIKDRLNTLKTLHENGIYVVLFMSPIFPYITDFKSIIETSKDYVNEYWFENLNLRGDYKYRILNYIAEKYPHFIDKYKEIYIKKGMNYWELLSKDIDIYCKAAGVKYVNFFYHEQLVKNKLENKNIRIKNDNV
ncbi:radical SAM protein [Clostridium estertheticum]|uniref:radical SAM protein n=1 Tax=Clostridium estertheticum TaxID=238834 RepID=UPI001C0BF0FF|nr:radical SAM protein [Clostridium estertheticum]MBU3183739.1 radical SAM protein [Clostridium estertheticum]